LPLFNKKRLFLNETEGPFFLYIAMPYLGHNLDRVEKKPYGWDPAFFWIGNSFYDRWDHSMDDHTLQKEIPSF
tara:strand:+ start:1507 stop:1725 length:219 start_codon:yes stop_codon:yes gene_type:complete